jgi:hypothetical protein
MRGLLSTWGNRRRRAIGAAGHELSAEHGQNRIVPQLVMVDEVLIAERDPEHALADEGR